MKVLFLAAEAEPYIKVGGLGDVAGALPTALRGLGHDVRLMMPRYGLLDVGKLGLTKVLDNFSVEMDWRHEQCQLWQNPFNGDRFIENHYFFGSRFQVYGCGDEVEQFVLFCRAALEACRLEGWQPDIIHAHDWHTGAAIRLAWASDKRPGLVFTIHNLAHQGNQLPAGWPLLGVYDGREPMNLMQQAIYCADRVTTVSPTYAREICGMEYGFGLDGLLRERGSRLSGVLNGLDTVSYNPATDNALPANYSAGNMAGKKTCREELHRYAGLWQSSGPLVGMVSRLDFQKGLDLVIRGLYDIVNYSNAKVMVLGSGNANLENQLRHACSIFPGRVACHVGYQPALARLVYAGSDIFLMPSLFEPCGISQMIAMRYGTLPVARATGGLADTIVDCRVEEGNGYGYLFEHYNHHEMLSALGQAIFDFEHSSDRWQEAVNRAMAQDFSWKLAAKRYTEIYQEALNH